MRSGDLVRFRQCTFHGEPKEYTEWRIGLLLEYEPWKRVAYILYNGERVSVLPNDAQIHQQAKRKQKN